jgi:integrase
MAGTKQEIRPGVWRLRVYVGRSPTGSPIYDSDTVHTGNGRPGSGVREADRLLAAMVAKGKRAEKPGTVDDLLTRWLDHSQSLGRSETTLREYRRIADRIIRPALGTIKLTRLKASDLDKLYAKLTSKGNKATTVRRVHALIAVALHQAEKWELVERNVSRQATPPPIHPAQVEAPSPKEVQALIAAAEAIDPLYGTVILVAALTGARRGELSGLRWSDIDWKANTITIERSVFENPGGGFGIRSTKSHQSRVIGLDSVGMNALRQHRDHVDLRAKDLELKVPSDAYLFSISPQGSQPLRPDLLTRIVERAGRKAKIKTHLHALRHFSATQGIGAGFDPVTVANRLGHSDPSITMKVYAHALEQRDRELASSLGEVLKG